MTTLAEQVASWEARGQDLGDVVVQEFMAHLQSSQGSGASGSYLSGLWCRQVGTPSLIWPHLRGKVML
jgi:hypothetical protein